MQLVIQNGTRAGQVFVLEKLPVRIGRDPGSTLHLDDHRVSRSHALLEPLEDGSWVCRDLQSTNCTYVNGRAVSIAVLKEGDRIRIGSTELLFTDGAAAGVASLDPQREIALEVDSESLQLALRSNAELRSDRSSFQEALFRIGMLEDPAKNPDEFLGEALAVVRQCVHHSTWAWIDWPDGSAGEQRVRGFRLGTPLQLPHLQGSWRLIQRAMARRAGLIATPGECRNDGSDSAVTGPLISALAAPILSGDGVGAVLYLDRLGSALPFQRDQLEWAASLASQIFVDLKNISLYRRLEQAFEQLGRSQSELVQAEKLAAIGRLAGGFAHDLNNPLGSILGFLELAQRSIAAAPREQLPEKLPRYLERAHAATGYCRALTRNLLAFARQKPAEADKTAFDAKEAIDAALNICFAAVQRSTARLEVTVPAGIILRGDPLALQQVIMNLVTNAADALEEMGPGHVGVIEVTGRGTPRGFEVTVRDNGPGIPLELQQKIFEPLFTTKESDRGTGLGLYVVRKIVAESGGSIHVRSRPGSGAEFSLIVPDGVAQLGSGDPNSTHYEIPIAELEEHHG